jgi:hypothetical protein
LFYSSLLRFLVDVVIVVGGHVRELREARSETGSALNLGNLIDGGIILVVGSIGGGEVAIGFEARGVFSSYSIAGV